jgi:hypothetical protein
MGTVTKLRQPFRKRVRSWWKLGREDRLGWMAVIMVIIAMIEDMRGHDARAAFVVGLAIVMLLLVRPQTSK